MDESTQIYDQAIQTHQAGRLDEAAALYEQVLAAEPEHWNACYLLGTLRLQQQRFEECLELLARVTAARPNSPDALNNQGVAYQALGRWEDAARAFEAAIRANPEYGQALLNLGRLMQDRQLYADAEKCFHRAAQLQADDVEAQLHLGNARIAQRKWQAAEDALRRAVALQPDNDDIQAQLGFVLARQEKLDEAAALYRKLLDARPDFYQVHNSLSYVYERQGKLDEAVAAAQRALEIRPDFPDGHNNLGNALRSLQRLEEACESFQRAVESAGDFPLAEFNLGTTRLLMGDYRRGWPAFARYRDLLDGPPRSFTQPEWDGQPVPGETLFAFADQGFGDTIQFVRFLPAVKHQSQARVVLECPAELQRLLQDFQDVDQVVGENESPPDFDRQISLSLVPLLLDVDSDDLRSPPYLPPARELRPELADLLDSARTSDMQVGLVWRGNPEQARDALRSCPLEKFMPLADMPGIAWFSLQTGDEAAEIETLKDRLPLLDVGRQLCDFADTAAVLERLDLLISVDTAAAHLAGAMGRPVWTLLSHAPDWRWLLDRDDSPWYPSMRLFRQPAWGDWDAVIHQVSAALRRKLTTS